MKSFRDYLEERWPQQPSLPTAPGSNPLTAGNIRQTIFRVANLISNFEPRDVTDCKDLLIDLQKVLEDKMTGA